MARVNKLSNRPVVDKFGRPFHPGDLVSAAKYDYVPYIIEGVDQQQGVIFISCYGSADARILRCSSPRLFQVFKRSIHE